MKKVILAIGVVLLLSFLPLVSSAQLEETEVELESHIRNGFRIATFNVLITNTGNETAHNVRIINATTEGNIFFNFQESKLLRKDIKPGEAVDIDTRSFVFGLGNFSLTVTVSCDEEVTSTCSVIGLIVGPFMIIP